MPAASLQIAERYRKAGQEEIAVAREWFHHYDGPKGVHCDPQTGAFHGHIGLNVLSDLGTRGITVSVESYRESDAILGLYLVATGES